VLDIVIKDKGVGISDIEQARQPMFTTGGTDRSGMGFTIMESFMTDLSISSEQGKGTTVHMRRRLQRKK
jgi:stage II sporulation protein AB (anti-sigma F factor)